MESYSNAGYLQLQPYHHHHHQDDRHLMMAEHHQPQPQVVRYNPTSVVEALPPGFKFLPTDLELIEFYLTPKLQKRVFPPGFMKPFLDVDLYKYNPEELIGMHRKLDENQESWYFFTPRERKYQNGSRPQRTIINGGYWKATAKDTEIIDYGGNVVGYRKVLDFYRGKHSGGQRSEWKMHEYLTKEEKDQQNLPSTSDSKKLNDWVLCKIYRNQRGTKRKQLQECEENYVAQEMNELDQRVDALLKLNDSLFENDDFWKDM